MTLNFLGMCSPPVVTATRQARAEIDLKRFAGWREASRPALLIEGVNQFAARFARTVLPGAIERRQRVLPVGLRNLVQLGEITDGPFLVDGEADLFGPTARIRLELRNAEPGAPCILRAEIAASPVGELPPAGQALAAPPSRETWDMGAEPLFTLQPAHGDGASFGFQVCADNPLLDEHFPGFPVAPGSLVLDFVWREACRRLGYAGLPVRISDARFTRPVTPGASYTCTLRAAGAENSYRFVLASGANVVHTQGVLDLRCLAPAPAPAREQDEVAEVVS